MNSRKEWIDGLRALAMLIVMTWHISNGINSQWLFSLITAPIMIPLFFSITGYVFNDCEGNQKLFYTKLHKISGITSKNGINDAKRLNIRVVTVSNDDKPKNRKTQRKADLRRRMVCKSLPVKE